VPCCPRRLVAEQGTNAVLRSRMERIQRQGANPAPGPAAAAAAAGAGGRVGGGGPLAALLAPDVQEELKAARTRLGFQEQEVSVEPCIASLELLCCVLSFRHLHRWGCQNKSTPAGVSLLGQACHLHHAWGLQSLKHALVLTLLGDVSVDVSKFMQDPGAPPLGTINHSCGTIGAPTIHPVGLAHCTSPATEYYLAMSESTRRWLSSSGGRRSRRAA
jgi:hypothetical protein